MTVTQTTTNLPKERLAPEVILASEAGAIPHAQAARETILAGRPGVVVESDAGSGLPRTPAPPRREGGKGWGVPGNLGILLLPDRMVLPAAQRLVVLVPDWDVSESGLAEYIWALASPRRLPVLLLGVSRNSQEQYRARRRLALVAAITRDDLVHVDIELALGQGWQQAVRHIQQPGDLVVCHGEQRLASGLNRRKLAEVLLNSLDTPVYVISGFYPEPPEEQTHWLAQLGSLLPPAIIIVLFFGLQARLTQVTTGSLQTILFILTVLVEFVLIAIWERLVGNLP
jgi:hypothetical protein